MRLPPPPPTQIQEKVYERTARMIPWWMRPENPVVSPRARSPSFPQVGCSSPIRHQADTHVPKTLFPQNRDWVETLGNDLGNHSKQLFGQAAKPATRGGAKPKQ